MVAHPSRRQLTTTIELVDIIYRSLVILPLAPEHATDSSGAPYTQEVGIPTAAYMTGGEKFVAKCATDRQAHKTSPRAGGCIRAFWLRACDTCCRRCSSMDTITTRLLPWWNSRSPRLVQCAYSILKSAFSTRVETLAKIMRSLREEDPLR